MPHHRTIRFPSSTNGIDLAGTLSLPEQATDTAALLLSGSGPQDRDETLAGQVPFRVLADHLLTAGVAVLRWDDRGVGDSQGDYLAIDADVLVDDIGQALDVAFRETGAQRAVLIGHSQGTLIATRAATRWPDRINGLVLLAGMGRPGRQVLLDQHREICTAEGLNTDLIEASLQVKEELFDALVAARTPTEARSEVTEILLGGAELSDLEADEREEVEAMVEDLLEWEWKFLLETAPATNLQQVMCPVSL